jgi:DUF4097 and DUF4098 domain-containing protein YvlB
MGRWLTVALLSLAMAIVAAAMVVSVLPVRADSGLWRGIGGAYPASVLNQTEIEDRALVVAGKPSLSVESANGSVTITRGGDGQVAVRAIKRGARPEDLRRLRVEIGQDGDRVNVLATTDRDGLGFNSIYGRVDLEIQLPAQDETVQVSCANGQIDIRDIAGHLDLRCGNGSISLVRVAGQIGAQSGNGRLRLEDGRGTIRLETRNGALTVQGFDGDLTLVTAQGRIAVDRGHGQLRVTNHNGAIDLRGVSLTGLNAISRNGSVYFEGRLEASSENRLETTHGSVTVALPAESALHVDLATGLGSLRVNLPIEHAEETRSQGRLTSLRGVIGRADASLIVRTNTGSITLNRQ